VRGSAAIARSRLRLRGPRRQKSDEREFLGGHAWRRQRRHKRARTGQRHYLDSVTQAQTHQPAPRIANSGRAGIGDQRDLRALFQFDHNFRGACDFVVLVIAHQALLNVEMREQLQRLARVFAGDRVRFFQNPQRPQWNIFQVADGRRDDVQASRAGLVRFGLGHTVDKGDPIAAGVRFAFSFIW
jgi:hypothetical protein